MAQVRAGDEGVTPEQWSRLKTIFHGAVDQPAEGRRAWLLRACQGDAELLQEADALIAAHDTAGGFLEEPAQIDPADVDTLIPGSHLGEDYQINSVIGRGGMGVVYLAHDFRLGRRVALKALPASVAASEELRQRLRREARAAATISHHAVATVYALEEINGDLYIASEYVPGHTLSSEIARGPIPEERARIIAREVAAALAAAHDAGVVHRDLKPDNVLINVEGVKVVDFGIAHIEGPESTRLTKAGAMLGTPAYMAPEQLLGGTVDARADIYAFGVMLSEVLTGRHPLSAPAASLDAPPIAADLVTIINRCLQPDPAARFDSGRDLLNALEDPGRSTAPRTAAAKDGAANARWWWQFHQAVAAIFYAAMLYPAWSGRQALGGAWGRTFFIVTLASVVVAVTLRLHLWFTSRSYPDQLKWARRRNGRWLRLADWLFVLTLAAGGLAIGDSALGIFFVAVALGVGAAFLVIEPATTRAAFRSG
jgi:hypothetical protein